MTAREPMRLSSVEFDLVTKSEANERFASKGGMFAKAHRVASQRKAVKEALGKLGAAPSPFFTPVDAAPSFTLSNRIEITITRIGPGTLDAHDNLRAALKAVVDAVCEDWIGLRDDDPRIKVMPARQEKTPGVSTQGPCPICLQPSGRPCLKPLTPTPMVKGLHAARRTPWRVRIEVRDLTPGPDRVLVLASTEPQKRKKTKPRPAKQNAPEGSEDHSARMLVPCSVHGAPIGQVCGPKFRHHGGVCAARGRLAGLVGAAAEVLAPHSLVANHDPACAIERLRADGRGNKPGCSCGRRRIVGPPVVRIALPWSQPRCAMCGGDGRTLVHRPGMPESARFVAACSACKGRGIVGPPKVLPDEKVSAAQPSKKYTTPPEHVARWGSEVVLLPRRYRSRTGETTIVFEWKGPRT